MTSPYDNTENAYTQQGQPGYDPNLAAGYGAHPAPPVLAHWGLRFGSGLIDILIAAVPAVIIGMVTGVSALSNVIELAVLCGIGYMEGTTAQSPGKKIVGLRVLREADGQLLGAGLGIGRRVLHVLDGLCCLIGYLWPIWDEKRQTFADKIVKSLVIVSE